jgi:hypothetical protein
MSIYTVHQPPLRAADALADPERFAFVRDGFAVWAFLLTPFWMLRHRLWLVLVIYAVVMAALDTALMTIGASVAVVFLVGVLISLLIGLESGTLRRFTLSRRGWKNVGIVSGHDRQDAEQRFFDAWTRKINSERATPSAAAPPPPRTPAATLPPRLPPVPGVIGLFPEPGAQR